MVITTSVVNRFGEENTTLNTFDGTIYGADSVRFISVLLPALSITFPLSPYAQVNLAEILFTVTLAEES